MTSRRDAIDLAHRCAHGARAGGGNVSVKTTDGVLHIKPSGVSLATLAEGDLVALRREVLLEALDPDIDEVDPEAAAAARARTGDHDRRPSVELLMHAVLDEPLAIHLHPVDVNAVTCHVDGERLTAELFGGDALWVGSVRPGLPLAQAIVTARAAAGPNPPRLVLMGNHGLLASGDTVDEVVALVDRASTVVASALERVQPPVTLVGRAHRVETTRIVPRIRAALASSKGLPVVVSDTSPEVHQLLDQGWAVVTRGPLIPDQIVYSGSLPAVIEVASGVSDDELHQVVTSSVQRFRESNRRDPVIVVVPGVGLFAAGSEPRTALTALGSFTDALATARDASLLGGVRVMDDAERAFIENWEVEAYRRGVEAGSTAAQAGGLHGTIALVTGAAQGFGLGIATELVRWGAIVALADLNVARASVEAERLCAEFGAGRAFAVEVDVTDQASQRTCVDEVVGRVGGIDLVVANAGIARAGSVFDQTASDFDLVTSVNYRGYFLTVQATAPVLAAQHRGCPSRWFDIVEINSKSGLEGSARNFAYSGSKFGGIGLTQSFALELASCGIKVNAICPGNFLDGPLWSDPERGLFVQYLKAGKVPGAQTVDEVRAFYESKVPMGRGCTPLDVARAVRYVVEQQYETGQAIPVTGGQTMIN